MRTEKRYFTLIELLVVIAIIAILAGAAAVAEQGASQRPDDELHFTDKAKWYRFKYLFG